MTYVIYFETKAGRECSIPSTESTLQEDVEWILSRGYTVTLVAMSVEE